ncbi:MAG: type II 3-dehydroquinate dehydratase [Gammaproteobacteria bacterium AqS3]|nr:type II 3-dehydroquinate dehydratase [Gammaproteobacteria bacterium AqS3]
MSTNSPLNPPATIHVIHGPNLNLLGQREPEIYGSETLDDITKQLERQARPLGIALQHFQSNSEGALIDYLQQLDPATVSFILINAAAYTHTSVALRDALLICDIPFIEVHLSNVYARESFRHDSLLSDIAEGVISGFGAHSYALGLRAVHHRLAGERPAHGRPN